MNLKLKIQDVINFSQEPLNIFHCDIAHMGNTEGLFFEVAITIGDHRSTLAQFNIEVSDADPAGVFHGCDGVGQESLCGIERKVFTCPARGRFQPLSMCRAQRFSKPSAKMSSIW